MVLQAADSFWDLEFWELFREYINARVPIGRVGGCSSGYGLLVVALKEETKAIRFKDLSLSLSL